MRMTQPANRGVAPEGCQVVCDKYLEHSSRCIGVALLEVTMGILASSVNGANAESC